MEIRALLIEWDQRTGVRAGNINPKEKSLRCNAWQNMDKTPAIELRLVEDDRDLAQYDGIKGVTVLIGKDKINKAIDENFPSKIIVEDELLYTEHFKEMVGEKEIKITKLPSDRTKRLKELKDKFGIKGIVEIEPQKV